jgi:hypothetical protein
LPRRPFDSAAIAADIHGSNVCFAQSLTLPATETGMADNNGTGAFGVILGAVVAVALAVFIVGGGSKKSVEGDKDLPPVADPAKPLNDR